MSKGKISIFWIYSSSLHRGKLNKKGGVLVTGYQTELLLLVGIWISIFWYTSDNGPGSPGTVQGNRSFALLLVVAVVAAAIQPMDNLIRHGLCCTRIYSISQMRTNDSMLGINNSLAPSPSHY